MSDLAREALLVQDACNLSGVVLGFGRAVTRLRALLDEAGNGGNAALHSHPVVVLWTNKLESLVHSEQRFSEAYAWTTEESGR
jgi:hypothetical protein